MVESHQDILNNIDQPETKAEAEVQAPFDVAEAKASMTNDITYTHSYLVSSTTFLTTTIRNPEALAKANEEMGPLTEEVGVLKEEGEKARRYCELLECKDELMALVRAQEEASGAIGDEEW